MPGQMALSGLRPPDNFDVPFVLAGRGRNHFRTGRYVRFARGHADPYRFKGRSETELFVEVLRACGVGATAFGDPAFYTRAMDNLRG